MGTDEYTYCKNNFQHLINYIGPTSIEECLNIFNDKLKENVDTFNDNLNGKCIRLNSKKTEYYIFTYDIRLIYNDLLSKLTNSRDPSDEKLIECFINMFDDQVYTNCCNCVSVSLYLKLNEIDDNELILARFLFTIEQSILNLQQYLPKWIYRLYIDPSIFNYLSILNRNENTRILYDRYLLSLKNISIQQNCEIYFTNCISYDKILEDDLIYLDECYAICMLWSFDYSITDDNIKLLYDNFDTYFNTIQNKSKLNKNDFMVFIKKYIESYQNLISYRLSNDKINELTYDLLQGYKRQIILQNKYGLRRVTRFLGFYENNTNINASREADGLIERIDCHNLKLLEREQTIGLVYNFGSVPAWNYLSSAYTIHNTLVHFSCSAGLIALKFKIKSEYFHSCSNKVYLNVNKNDILTTSYQAYDEHLLAEMFLQFYISNNRYIRQCFCIIELNSQAYNKNSMYCNIDSIIDNSIREFSPDIQKYIQLYKKMYVYIVTKPDIDSTIILLNDEPTTILKRLYDILLHSVDNPTAYYLYKIDTLMKIYIYNMYIYSHISAKLTNKFVYCNNLLDILNISTDAPFFIFKQPSGLYNFTVLDLFTEMMNNIRSQLIMTGGKKIIDYKYKYNKYKYKYKKLQSK